VRAESAALLQQRIDAALGALTGIATVETPTFSTDPATCEMYWKVRKGTFPSVGAMRRAGTTVIIEDVAFPIESLAAATLDLQALLRQHGYTKESSSAMRWKATCISCSPRISAMRPRSTATPASWTRSANWSSTSTTVR
jgi:FAD/FMN-containing dehydrogenase